MEICISKEGIILLRGLFGASGALTVSAGITLVYVLGATLNWRAVCAACGALPVAIATLMLALPETPNWLAANGNATEAEKVRESVGRYTTGFTL